MSDYLNNVASSGNYVSGNYKTEDASSTQSTSKKKISGKTFGDAKLTDTAAKYYESLTKKYSNMEFVLVSDDKKEFAKANAASFATPGKTVVLIGESEVEKMATDEDFRADYESKIEAASKQIPAMLQELADSGNPVESIGMSFDDKGNASYFAVIDESLAAQKERIEEKREAKRETAKAEAKEAQKEQLNERIEAARASRTDAAAEASESSKASSKTIIKASSMEELKQKISDYYMALRSDNVLTDAEKQIGQQFDWKG